MFPEKSKIFYVLFNLEKNNFIDFSKRGVIFYVPYMHVFVFTFRLVPEIHPTLVNILKPCYCRSSSASAKVVNYVPIGMCFFWAESSQKIAISSTLLQPPEFLTRSIVTRRFGGLSHATFNRTLLLDINYAA